MFEHPPVSRLVVCVGAGVISLLLGFGVLNIFYWTGGPYEGPGIFGYWSSSVGDSLLIPVIIGAITWLNTSGSTIKRDNVLGGSAALLGTVLGAAIQASWLADPAPILNWTLPRPGHFTVAGWYHAAFLVVTVALVSGGSLRAASRLARRGRGEGDWRALVILAAAGLAFGMLLAADNMSRQPTNAGSATLIGLALGVSLLALLLVVGAVTRSGRKDLDRTERTKRAQR